MMNKNRLLASCTCGQVAFETIGAPILSAVCYCESCREAARRFEHAPGAPPVLNPSGGVDYCLFRKDRVTLARGADHLSEHRLTAASPTRRLVARCCNTPMFADFTRGHWLTLYRDRLGADAPAPEIGVMGKDRPVGYPSPAQGVTVYPHYPARFMVKLVAAWAAMGFRKPKTAW
ncbi:MAG TPA: hypothetical protein VJP88_10630 [Caulobacteraceae bacterium]|nr:hypothetical protein [Caulobacteraceae bacterium]